MSKHRRISSTTVFVAGAMVTGLLISAGTGWALDLSQKQRKKNSAKQTAKQQLNVKELDRLERAYMLVDTANASYGGHRVNALHALDNAIDLLEARIARKGSNRQRQQALQDEAVSAYFSSLRQALPTKLEPQTISDAQIFQATRLLRELRPSLARQQKIRGHVDEAIRELNAALRAK